MFPINARWSLFKVKGNDATKSPMAGVGNPMKEVVCLSSMLNLARRKAANIARKNAAKATRLKPDMSMFRLSAVGC